MHLFAAKTNVVVQWLNGCGYNLTGFNGVFVHVALCIGRIAFVLLVRVQAIAGFVRAAARLCRLFRNYITLLSGKWKL